MNQLRNPSRSWLPIAVSTLLRGGITIALGITLAQVIFEPTAKSPQYASYIFPETVPLKHWQPVTGQPTQLLTEPLSPSSESISGDVLAQHRYFYQKEQTTLEIAAHYVVNTDGDLKPIITQHTGQLLSALKHDSDSGFYSLYTHQGRAYLSTCQNAQGRSTVTGDQFQRSRLIHDSNWTRVMPWLRGQATLPDQRCLWMQLSVPVRDYESTAAAYESLETAWRSWSQWWRGEFPAELPQL